MLEALCRHSYFSQRSPLITHDTVMPAEVCHIGIALVLQDSQESLLALISLLLYLLWTLILHLLAHTSYQVKLTGKIHSQPAAARWGSDYATVHCLATSCSLAHWKFYNLLESLVAQVTFLFSCKAWHPFKACICQTLISVYFNC